MSLNIACALALLITCLVAFGIFAFARWHKKRYLRIPYWRVNEFRITPKFSVGSDVK